MPGKSHKRHSRSKRGGMTNIVPSKYPSDVPELKEVNMSPLDRALMAGGYEMNDLSPTLISQKNSLAMADEHGITNPLNRALVAAGGRKSR